MQPIDEQTASKLSNEEYMKLLRPSGWERIDFWMSIHLSLLWRVCRWNWFNLWTGERGFRLFARHGFREWGK